ncbi:drug/metabolite transporter permease [Xanthomonas translucens DAR61454]|nr:drug/metabolite transporter permease [Xanthomonas translucens DAR61454]
MTAQRARRRAAHCGAVTASGTRIGQHGDVGDGPLAHLRAETVAAEVPTKARDQASWLALGGNPSSSAGSADIGVRSSSASRLSQWMNWLTAGLSVAPAAFAGAAASLLMYYRLIQRIGPARASTVTYLVPVFGALLSWSILGEPLTWSMLLAGVLILGSVAFSQRAR